MKKSLLSQALSIAAKKRYNHPEKNNFIHFTFIVQNNTIIEWGRNNRAIPKNFGYHKRISDPAFGPKTHSEIDAYKKAKGLLERNKSFEIINIRLNKAGEIRNSKPCACCYEILKLLGCSKFFYSSNIGFLAAK